MWTFIVKDHQVFVVLKHLDVNVFAPDALYFSGGIKDIFGICLFASSFHFYSRLKMSLPSSFKCKIKTQAVSCFLNKIYNIFFLKKNKLCFHYVVMATQI